MFEVLLCSVILSVVVEITPENYYTWELCLLCYLRYSEIIRLSKVTWKEISFRVIMGYQS